MIKHDSLGPEKLIEVYDQKTKMKGFLVIDNTWLGVAKGGIRMTPMVTQEEVFHLARRMTYKNALSDLPFGGGKSGILISAKNISVEKKGELIRAFSKAVKELCPSIYIAGPDVNTGEKEMAEFVKANGDLSSATGKPEEMKGLPHELGSTGFGVVQAILEAVSFMNRDIKSMSAAVAGFGNVGSSVAGLLEKEGAKIVAISDSGGTIYNPSGLVVQEVVNAKKENGSVVKSKNGQQLKNEEIFTLPVDILVPAALGGVITDKNANDVKAKIIAEGANLPVRPDAELVLNRKGVLIIPDIIANAGGVISSYAEHKGFDEDHMFKLVESKIKTNVKKILEKSKEEDITTREAAIKIAHQRLESARK